MSELNQPYDQPKEVAVTGDAQHEVIMSDIILEGDLFSRMSIQPRMGLRAISESLLRSPLPFDWEVVDTLEQKLKDRNVHSKRTFTIVTGAIAAIGIVAGAILAPQAPKHEVVILTNEQPNLVPEITSQASSPELPKLTPTTTAETSTSPEATISLSNTVATSKSSIVPSIRPKVTTKSKPTTETIKTNPNIQLGIPMLAPQKLIVRNPDGTVLINVTTVPYSGDLVGQTNEGKNLYSFDPPVGLSPSDQEANYIQHADQKNPKGGVWQGFMGEPNTLPKKPTLPDQVAPQDDDVVFMSHSRNDESDPTRWLPFQQLINAKVGATAEVVTGNGDFVYRLDSKVRTISKLLMPNDGGTWDPIKDTIVIVTCKAAIGADGIRVPKQDEDNITSRWDMVAAKKLFSTPNS